MVFVPVGQVPPAEIAFTDAMLIERIRDFLGDIDPETGYIE
jgi:hypothetical protein